MLAIGDLFDGVFFYLFERKFQQKSNLRPYRQTFELFMKIANSSMMHISRSNECCYNMISYRH